MGRQSTIDLDNDLDVRFGRSASNAPATFYIGLVLGEPSEDGLTYEEITGGGYARVAVTNSAANFPAATDGVKSMHAAVNFPIATSDWTGYDYLCLFDAASNGRARAWCQVSGQILVPTGSFVAVAADSVKFTATA